MVLKPKAAFLTLVFALLCSGRTLRVSGVIQPLHSYVVQVPLIEGQGGGQPTLTRLVQNGIKVNKGELLAEFDSTKQEQSLRDAAAKYEDLSHQVEQKAAEHRNNAAKRKSDLEQAMADLAKAQIEMRKGPILSDIDRQKTQIKVQDGQDHVASLQKSIRFHEEAEAAESRILELQRDRQKFAVQREQANIEKLTLRAPLSGMVALQNVFRNDNMGHAQEGDQLWPGQALLRLFDPGEMVVEASIQEPDAIALSPGTRAIVHLDAYPGSAFPAVFETASPVASGGMQSPIRTFSARFRVLTTDPHLLPDLSAATDIEVPQ
jgi:multidrug resistance efflux pump